MEDLAIETLVAAARRLPLAHREELSRRLIEDLILARQNHDHDLSPYAARRARAIGALRAVAETIGHAPTTTEYDAEVDRRRALGDTTLPVHSTITNTLHGWPGALAAAGLVPDVGPTALQRRRNYTRKRIHRYSKARL